jgi:hypothetical protein
MRARLISFMMPSPLQSVGVLPDDIYLSWLTDPAMNLLALTIA